MAKPQNQAAAGRILRNRPRTPEEVLPGEPSAAARRGAQAGVMADIPGGLVDLARGGLGYAAAGLEALLSPDVAEGLGVSGFRRYMMPYTEEEKRQARQQYGAPPVGSSERIEEELVKTGALPPATGTREEFLARLLAGFADAAPGPVGAGTIKPFPAAIAKKIMKTVKEAGEKADFTVEMPKPKTYKEVIPDQADKIIDDAPIIDPQDLVGKKVFPIVADLTDAGAFYVGIDSSKVDPQFLMGGPKYPELASSKAAGSVWAVQGKSVARQKLEKDADYGVVVAMMPTSHISNPQVANAITNTNIAYARDGKISPENIEKLNKLVRNKFEDFPGLDSPKLETYLSRGEGSFEKRAEIGKTLSSAEAEELGAANVSRILRATQDPNTYSLRRNDAILVVEIDKTQDPKDMSNLIRLGEVEGTKEHPSYTYGIKGRIVGKFARPVSWETIWGDWIQKKTQEGVTGLIRSFDLQKPVVEITPQKAAEIGSQAFTSIQGPRQLEVASLTVTGKWFGSDIPTGKGGASPANFSRAIRSSDAAPTLTPYNEQQLKEAVKSGEMTLYQLGGGPKIEGKANNDTTEIYFALKRGIDYNGDYGLDVPDFTPDDVGLVSVINNEPGAKGIGGPGVVLKAIEEGATALDAFAVPSKRFPDGFLPELYSEFGFEEVARLPFNKDYYIQDNSVPDYSELVAHWNNTAGQTTKKKPSYNELVQHYQETGELDLKKGERAYNDLLDYWRSTGWDESMGAPDLVFMKFRGDDASRSGTTQRFLSEGRVYDRGRTTSTASTARRAAEQRSGPDVLPEQPTSGPDLTGADPRSAGAGNRAPLSSKFAGVVEEIASLPPQQAQRLGVTPDAYKMIQKIAQQRAARKITP